MDLTKSIIKAYSLWMNDYDNSSLPHKGIASHGIWEILGVHQIDEGENNGKHINCKVYTLRCFKSYNPFWVVGDEVKMYEDVILGLMTQVEIVKKEKILPEHLK